MQLLALRDIDVIVFHHLRKDPEEHDQVAEPTIEAEHHIEFPKTLSCFLGLSFLHR